MSVRLRFTGPSISVRLRDTYNRYTVLIDGIERDCWRREQNRKNIPLPTTWGGDSRIAVDQASRIQLHQGRVLGVRLSDGHTLQPPPARSMLRMEFIGDSCVACYGCGS